MWGKRTRVRAPRSRHACEHEHRRCIHASLVRSCQCWLLPFSCRHMYMWACVRGRGHGCARTRTFLQTEGFCHHMART